MNSNNKVAVVTGGNRGLGLELCKQLASTGYTVILTARSLEAAKKAASTFPSNSLVLPFELDISDPKSIDNLSIRLGEAEISQIDVLIHNAGVNLDHPDLTPGSGEPPSLFTASKELFVKTFETNVLGSYLVTRNVLPLLRKSPSAKILNISSGMGQLSTMGSGYPAYRISKTALNALTKLMAAEFADTGMTVNSVCPGWVRTDMGGPNAALSPEDAVRNILWLIDHAGEKSGRFFQNREEIPW